MEEEEKNGSMKREKNAVLSSCVIMKYFNVLSSNSNSASVSSIVIPHKRSSDKKENAELLRSSGWKSSLRLHNNRHLVWAPTFWIVDADDQKIHFWNQCDLIKIMKQCSTFDHI